LNAIKFGSSSENIANKKAKKIARNSKMLKKSAKLKNSTEKLRQIQKFEGKIARK